MRLNVNILKITGLLSMFLTLLLSSQAHAVIVEHLYEAEIPVTDQSRQARQDIFQQAFQQTLIRVVGNSDTVLSSPEINEARKNVVKYVSQFRYRELPEGFQQPVVEAAANMPEAQKNTITYTNMLWIQFDMQAVNRLLRESHLPVWGQQRPSTLVWIAVRDGGQRYILREQDRSPIKDELEKAAAMRGLPLAWPSNDQTDQSRMSFVDLWGGFWDNILSASRRYQAESVLVGRYLWQGSQWQVKWDLLSTRHLKYWAINSRDLGLLAAEGADSATDKISQKYALFLRESTSAGNFYIDVHGIESADDYARAMSYLQTLPPIKDLNASEVNEQGIRFTITAQGSVDDVKRLIALGHVLAPYGVQVSRHQAQQNDIVLAYQLR